MSKSDLLRFFTIPVGILIEWRFISWALLTFAIGWFASRKLFGWTNFSKQSSVLWWVIFLYGSIAILLLITAFFLTPKGPDRYPYFALLLASAPFAVAVIVTAFLKP